MGEAERVGKANAARGAAPWSVGGSVVEGGGGGIESVGAESGTELKGGGAEKRTSASEGAVALGVVVGLALVAVGGDRVAPAAVVAVPGARGSELAAKSANTINSDAPSESAAPAPVVVAPASFVSPSFTNLAFFFAGGCESASSVLDSGGRPSAVGSCFGLRFPRTPPPFSTPSSDPPAASTRSVPPGTPVNRGDSEIV